MRIPSPTTVIAIVALVFATGGGAVVAQTAQRSAPTFTMLKLQNGWTSSPFGFPTSGVVFTSVDMCNATCCRLEIEPTGVVTVEAQDGAFSNAACFTGLDGASFAKQPRDIER